jgi:hypothetical protein
MTTNELIELSDGSYELKLTDELLLEVQQTITKPKTTAPPRKRKVQLKVGSSIQAPRVVKAAFSPNNIPPIAWNASEPVMSNLFIEGITQVLLDKREGKKFTTVTIGEFQVVNENEPNTEVYYSSFVFDNSLFHAFLFITPNSKSGAKFLTLINTDGYLKDNVMRVSHKTYMALSKYTPTAPAKTGFNVKLTEDVNNKSTEELLAMKLEPNDVKCTIVEGTLTAVANFGRITAVIILTDESITMHYGNKVSVFTDGTTIGRKIYRHNPVSYYASGSSINFRNFASILNYLKLHAK